MSGDNLNKEEREQYSTLIKIFDHALARAAIGKGKERHADGLPFDKQQMLQICRSLGSADGLYFQAMKKINEQKKLKSHAKVNELLDAMVYLAGAVIYEREKMLEI